MLTTVDRSIWDAFSRDNAFYHTVSWDAYRNPEQVDRNHYWQSGITLVDELLALAGLTPSPSWHALEIGSGLGRLTRALAARCGSAAGVDISPQMVDTATNEASAAGIENVAFSVCDGASLSGILDVSADLVLCFTVFQHLSDRALALGYIDEIARVLRPGGHAIVQCPTWQASSVYRSGWQVTSSAVRSLTQPIGAARRLKNVFESRQQVKALHARLAAGRSESLSADEVRIAMHSPARRMKSIHLGRLQRWIADAGLELTLCDRPGQTYTTVVLRRPIDLGA